MLVQFLVGLFNNPTFNKNNAQLIFATHDTNLLDLKMFRRDQIYFIEKDAYGNSELYSLDNFSVRKSENVRLAYLLGRYGAIPNIVSGGVL
jgi:AAA15 family ATPase/GTPase